MAAYLRKRECGFLKLLGTILGIRLLVRRFGGAIRVVLLKGRLSNAVAEARERCLSGVFPVNDSSAAEMAE